MNKKFRLIFVLLMILIVPTISAFTPPSDIDGRDFYRIYNFTNISADLILENGSQLLSDESVLNVNSSVYWDGINSTSQIDNVNSSTYWDGETSQADLNVNSSTYSTYWGTLLSQNSWFLNTAGVLGFNTTLLNNTLDGRYYTQSAANSQFIAQADEASLNVNGSVYWNLYNTVSTWFTSGSAELSLNTTVLNNTLDGRYIEQVNEATLNVNSSSFWDLYDTVSTWFTSGSSELSLNTTVLNDTLDGRYYVQATADSTFIAQADETSLNVNSSTFANRSLSMDWVDLYGYPAACPAGQFITTVGDTIICEASNQTINLTGESGVIVNGSVASLNTTFTDLLYLFTAGGGIDLTGLQFTVAGNTALTQDADGLSVTADGIGDTQLEYNTGQHLTTTSDPTFNNLTLSDSLNPAANTTLGGGLQLAQGQQVCFDLSCTHFIYENSSGVLIIT